MPSANIRTMTPIYALLAERLGDPARPMGEPAPAAKPAARTPQPQALAPRRERRPERRGWFR